MQTYCMQCNNEWTHSFNTFKANKLYEYSSPATVNSHLTAQLEKE